MSDSKRIEELWWFIYNHLLIGKVAMTISILFVVGAVFVFIRWKMFGLSMLLLSLSVTVAYLGGFLKMIGGGF